MVCFTGSSYFVSLTLNHQLPPMQLHTLDWIIIGLFFAITLAIGLYAGLKASRSSKDFFLSGRDMPWWLLGVSMVATTFSADTPNLVTNIVRAQGVAGNWAWWAFLITGMTTVFIYAKLWRRSGMTTDLGFYELRYSGKPAAFLRGFRAIYLGLFFNVAIMATVMLAGIKIAGILLGWSPLLTVAVVTLITVLYSSIGGLRGVILTDFFQFALSMVGMIIAAVLLLRLPQIGGLDGLMEHPAVQLKQSLFPDFNDPEVYVPLLLMPILVQWWSTWYPGAEPGGGGYVAQRMLSARDEKDAIKATFFYNFAHYALRPWPWILIALASLIVYPSIADVQNAFPEIDASIMGEDLAFPAMLALLPSGLLGLLIAALLAALMSTLSTHLNWGASYIVEDVYARFINVEASDATKVWIGRLSTIVLAVLGGAMALWLDDALEGFQLLLQIGAGTGLLFLLRWFWWRINAYSEIAAMCFSLVVAIYFTKFYVGTMPAYMQLLCSVGITTVGWLLVTLMTRPTDKAVRQQFFDLIRPHSFGWKNGVNTTLSPHLGCKATLGQEIALAFCGMVAVYGALLGVGWLLYGKSWLAFVGLTISVICATVVFRKEFR